MSFVFFVICIGLCMFCCLRTYHRKYRPNAQQARERREHLESLNMETSERRQAAISFLMSQLNMQSERQPNQETRVELIQKSINTEEVKDKKEILNLIEDLRYAGHNQNELTKSNRSVISVAWDTAKDSVRSNHSVSVPECSICLEAYEKGEKICCAKTDECAHVFHQECLTLWLKENDDCPLCRCKIIDSSESSVDMEMASEASYEM